MYLLPAHFQQLLLIFPRHGPPPPHPIMYVSFRKLRWAACGVGVVRAYPQALVQIRAQLLVQQGGTLCPAAQCGVRAAGREAEREAAV